MGGDEGFLGSLGKIAKAEVTARVKAIRNDPDAPDEIAVLQEWPNLDGTKTETKRRIRELEDPLDPAAHDRYPRLR